MSPVVSVVVPVYCNALSLPVLAEELRAVERDLAERQASMQLIFIDDGSVDESVQVLRNIKASRPETTVAILSRNFGADPATKAGFRFVTGDCFIVVAADLQDPPELIVRMYDRWARGSKFVIAEREHREDSWATRFFAGTYYTIVRRFIVRSYPRLGYDMALMDRSLLPYVLTASRRSHTSLYGFWLGYAPDYITYVRAKRVHGKSMWSISKRVDLFIGSVFEFSFLPLRILSGVGFLVFLVGGMYGLNLALSALRAEPQVPGFRAIATLTLFLGGTILVMLGIIGEYVVRTLDQVNGRPETVIDEIV